MKTPALDVNVRDIHGFNVLMWTMQEIYPDHALIQYMLARPDLDLTTTTYSDTFFHRHPRMLHIYRGASALFLATESVDLFQYIPTILDRLESNAHDYTECKKWHRSHSYIEKRSPLTNLVTALAKCKEEQRPLTLFCIERIANIKADAAHEKSSKQQKDLALQIAAKNGDRQVVEILLATGANKELRDEQGRSVVELARYAGYPELAKVIQNYAKSSEAELEKMWEGGRLRK